MSTIDAMSPGTAVSRRPVLMLMKMVLAALWDRHAERRQLRRTRVHLMELSDAELADIGLTREAADREASRSLLAIYLNMVR